MKSKKIISALVISAILASGTAIAFSSSKEQSTKNMLLFTNNNTYDYCVVNDNRNLVLTNKNGKVTSYVSTGQMVEVLSNGKSKSLVKIKETGDTGYINNQDIRLIKSGVNAQMDRENLTGETINISSSVNLRENPSLNSTILRTVPNDTQLKILGKQGEWFKVCIDNSVGFIYEEYIGVNKVNSSNLTNNNSSNGVVKTTNGAFNKSLVHNSVINIPNKNILHSSLVTSNIITSSSVNTINSENSTSKVKNTKSNNMVNSDINKKENVPKKKDIKVKSVVDNNPDNSTANKSDTSKNKTSNEDTNKVVSNDTHKKVDAPVKKDTKVEPVAGSKIDNNITKKNDINNIKPNKVVSNDTNKKNIPVKKSQTVKPIKQNEKVEFKVSNKEFKVSEPNLYNLYPSIGESILLSSPNSSYKEFSYNQLGATATINGKNANISFSGNVNNQVPGVYPVEMSVKVSSGKVVSKKIDVEIKDVPPIIVLNNTNTIQVGSDMPYSDFIIGAYSVEGQNLSNNIECYGSPIGVLNQSQRFYEGPTTLKLSVKDQYGTVGTATDVLSVPQTALPTITGKNVVLKQGQKFNYSDLDINVQNGYIYSVQYTTDAQGEDFIQSIPDKKGTYYVWVTATNNDMYTCSENMYKVTVL